MKLGTFVDRFALIVLTVAAAAAAATVVRREWFPNATRRTPAPITLTYVEAWEGALRHSSRIADAGPESPTLMIVSDYECPACRSFEDTRNQLHSVGVGIEIVHLPIPRHRFARPSIVAARCAEAQGRFRELHELILDKQDSLGLISFSDLARRAGVRDPDEFQACSESTVSAAFVDSSNAAALALGATATPTVILNGWRYSTTPPLKVLLADIDRVRMGKRPSGDSVQATHRSASETK